MDKGKHEDGLDFANLSTCALELAEARVVGSRASTRGLILPIQALVCSNWQKRGGAWARTGSIGVVGQEWEDSVLPI